MEVGEYLTVLENVERALNSLLTSVEEDKQTLSVADAERIVLRCLSVESRGQSLRSVISLIT